MVDTILLKFMSRFQKTFYRYSNCFKEKVVQEVSSGSSISEVCRRYDIKGTGTVQSWIKKYGRTDLLNKVIRVKMRSEDDKFKQLEAENRRLKVALADAILVKDVLETLIDVVDEHYQTDVKKNFGHKLLSAVPLKNIKK
jgi:transposase-like protein